MVSSRAVGHRSSSAAAFSRGLESGASGAGAVVDAVWLKPGWPQRALDVEAVQGLAAVAAETSETAPRTIARGSVSPQVQCGRLAVRRDQAVVAHLRRRHPVSARSTPWLTSKTPQQPLVEGNRLTVVSCPATEDHAQHLLGRDGHRHHLVLQGRTSAPTWPRWWAMAESWRPRLDSGRWGGDSASVRRKSAGRPVWQFAPSAT